MHRRWALPFKWRACNDLHFEVAADARLVESHRFARIARKIDIGIQTGHVRVLGENNGKCREQTPRKGVCKASISGVDHDSYVCYFCRMKVISILVPETAVPAAIVDPSYMFRAVNTFLQQQGQSPLFKIQLVGITPEVALSGGSVVIRTDQLLAEDGPCDLVIIPALSGDLGAALQANRAFLPWIVKRYKQGAELASLCVGAFLLAETGLLRGSLCSTHWLFAQEFRAMFPDVTLVDERVVTDQNGIYSSGGASAYWNLLLHIVEKYTSREMAILAAKFFVLDISRESQAPFMIFRGQKKHEDAVIKQAQDLIEDRFQDRITIDDLADKFGVGRRTFERRFKKATSNTVIEYIQRVKIEAAKSQLENGRKTVAEVMYEVGYTDVKAFRDVFKRIAGMSPIDYRNHYSRLTANS